MILSNAIYFKSSWVSKFDKANTAEADFYAEGATQKAQMMRQTSAFSYYKDENAQYISLPYGNTAFNMLIMLPGEGKTADDVISSLNADTWCASKMGSKEVNLSMPRFKTSYECSMNDVLSKLGMGIVFTEHADLSSMIKEQGFVVGSVLQKAYIEVNEEGTEAAAVTSVNVAVTSIESPVEFNVNKPFAFAIYEKSTEAILFMGKVGSVAEEEQ